MGDLISLQNMLQEALKNEKMAEDNCAEILKELTANGFHDQVEKIKNDEAHHQKIVQNLLNML